MAHGGETAPKPHGALAAHLRALGALHQSLFAPQFRALETYGDAPPPAPTPADIVAAAHATAAWHAAKEIEVAAELAERRAAAGNPILLDEAARTLAHHRAERERIAQELSLIDGASVPQQAAE